MSNTFNKIEVLKEMRKLAMEVYACNWRMSFLGFTFDFTKRARCDWDSLCQDVVMAVEEVSGQHPEVDVSYTQGIVTVKFVKRELLESLK